VAIRRGWRRSAQLCLCTTLRQDGLTARLLVVPSSRRVARPRRRPARGSEEGTQGRSRSSRCRWRPAAARGFVTRRREPGCTPHRSTRRSSPGCARGPCRGRPRRRVSLWCGVPLRARSPLRREGRPAPRRRQSGPVEPVGDEPDHEPDEEPARAAGALGQSHGAVVVATEVREAVGGSGSHPRRSVGPGEDGSVRPPRIIAMWPASRSRSPYPERCSPRLAIGAASHLPRNPGARPAPPRSGPRGGSSDAQKPDRALSDVPRPSRARNDPARGDRVVQGHPRRADRGVRPARARPASARGERER
jgi:hypothetical protein